jgi:hypothetical protein
MITDYILSLFDLSSMAEAVFIEMHWHPMSSLIRLTSFSRRLLGTHKHEHLQWEEFRSMGKLEEALGEDFAFCGKHLLECVC